MARYHGVVGYGQDVEDPPDSGVWKTMITERSYTGDVIRNLKQSNEGEGLNDDISVSNSISIVADDYAIQHLSMIKYVDWQGVSWTVTSVEVRAPRLILNIGSVYNGPKE